MPVTLVGMSAGRRIGTRLIVGLAVRMMRLSSIIWRVVRKDLYLSERVVAKASAVVKSTFKVINVSLDRTLSNSASRSCDGGSDVSIGGLSGSLSLKLTVFLLVVSGLSCLFPLFLSCLLTAFAVAFAALDLAAKVLDLAMMKVVSM